MASTPSAALIAASPYLKSAIADIVQAITTVATGDPALAPARLGPAFAILVNQLMLLEPGLLAAELGTGAQSLITDLNALAAKLP